MEVFYIYFAFSFVALTFGSPHVSQYEIKDGKKKDSSLDDKLQLLHNFGSLEKQTIQKGPVKLKSYSFKDCGASTALGHIISLSVTPDPLHFPGPLNVAANFNITSPLGAPLMGDVVIKRKVLGKFVKLPCIDNFGSCKYPDLCALLEQVQCPDPLVKIGIDCTCPLKTNSYTLPKTEFGIDASVVPTGDYHVIAKTTYMGHQGFCIDLTISFE